MHWELDIKFNNFYCQADVSYLYRGFEGEILKIVDTVLAVLTY